MPEIMGGGSLEDRLTCDDPASRAQARMEASGALASIEAWMNEEQRRKTDPIIVVGVLTNLIAGTLASLFFSQNRSPAVLEKTADSTCRAMAEIMKGTYAKIVARWKAI